MEFPNIIGIQPDNQHILGIGDVKVTGTIPALRGSVTEEEAEASTKCRQMQEI